MTNQVEHLILDHLRAPRADIGGIRHDVRDIKLRVGSLESHVSSVLGDVLRQDTRMDASSTAWNRGPSGTADPTEANRSRLHHR